MLRNGKRLRYEEPRSENQVDPERNPLLNKDVLKVLFGFCKLSDLFDYRLVSKDWYSSSLPRIRTEATVKICNPNVRYYRGGGGYLNWTKFHPDFQVDGEQFQSFKLFDVYFLDLPSPSQLPECSSLNPRVLKGRAVKIKQTHKNMDQFWTQCGQFIRELTLRRTAVYSVEAFKKAIFEQTPNLEKLTLEGVVIEDGGDVPQAKRRRDEVVNVNSKLKHLNLSISFGQGGGQFPFSWRVLFDHFPNIESLEIDTGNPIASLVTKLKSQDEVLLKVLKMRFMTKKQSESVVRLVQLPKLKLRRLDLEFGAFKEDEKQIIIHKTLQTALRFQGDHLESLFVYTRDVILEYDESEPMNNFPFRREPLQNLTHLEFSGICSNFNFLQQTPNLKYLRLLFEKHIKVLDEADMEILGTTKLPFLSEFHFYRRCILEKEMQVFVKIMPNVERFHALIDSGAFRVICGNWLRLRELVVSQSYRLNPEVDYVGDEAITGIVDGREERLPNITQLQCLEKLELMDTGKIGDASIWNGFLKLPKLATLGISLSPETSDEAYTALLTRFPKGRFDRSEPRY